MKLSTLATAVSVALVASTSTLAGEQDDLRDELEVLKEQVRKLQIKTGGQRLQWGVDYRVTVDSIEYDLADGTTAENSSLISNRLLLNMGYKYNDKLVFRGQLSYQKAYGDTAQHSQRNASGFADFDWFVNENLFDNNLRVKEAYFLYFGDAFMGNDKLPWTFSLGRRPSTNGFLVNNREGFESAKSPLGHSINVEFDGLSLSVKTDKVFDIPGSAIKLCAGRGLSNAMSRLTPTGTDYATDEQFTDNIDMVGFIITPYNDGQYDIKAQIYYANNLIGMDMNQIMMNGNYQFYDFGDLSNFTLSMQVNGIGEFISDFLDETRVFVSYSQSKTHPADGMAMLGSTESETGDSYWVGVNFPGFADGDSFGIEFNSGSQYWRSFTYGEDTLAGSKLAARGDAFEVYYNYPIIDKALTFQLRYTSIEYDYTGSQGFFGNATGTPMSIADASMMATMFGIPQPVEKASDLRMTLRYQF